MHELEFLFAVPYLSTYKRSQSIRMSCHYVFSSSSKLKECKRQGGFTGAIKGTIVSIWVFLFYFFFHPRWQEGVSAMAGWISEGKIVAKETIVEGFMNTPQALVDQFTGKNLGKMVIKL